MGSSNSVLIIGSGPVGLTAACELIRRGISCRIIDKSKGPSEFSKAFAVHARTLESIETLGITEDFLSRGIEVPIMHFYDHAKRLVTIDFSDLDTKYPYVLSIPQSGTEVVLRDRLESLGGEVEQEITLTHVAHKSNGVEVSLQHADGRKEDVVVDWLIGTDGAHSTVRSELNIGWEGKSYNIDFIVADGLLISGPSEPHGHTYLTRCGYVMLFPLPGGYHRVVLDLSNEEKLDRKPEIDDVNRMLRERGLSHLEFRDPFWLSAAHIRKMLASNYRKGRVLLAGDACHVHSPVGGQGLNTGIQDAQNLAWKLALVCKGRASESLLDSYEVERRPVAAEMLANTDALTRTLTDRNPIKRVIRTRILPLISKLPKVRRYLPKQAAGLTINYESSPIVASELKLQGQVQVGHRAPDCTLKDTVKGTPVRLMGEVISEYYTLMICLGTHASESAVSKIEASLNDINDYLDLVNVLLITTSPIKSSSDDLKNLVDIHGKVHSIYTGERGGLCVIRPDGYLALTADLGDWKAVHAFFSSHLQPLQMSGNTILFPSDEVA